MKFPIVLSEQLFMDPPLNQVCLIGRLRTARVNFESWRQRFRAKRQKPDWHWMSVIDVAG